MILEYFEEASDNSDHLGHCCDVCQVGSTDVKNCTEEMTAIMRAVQEIPDKGEKKVCLNNNSLSKTLPSGLILQ